MKRSFLLLAFCVLLLNAVHAEPFMTQRFELSLPDVTLAGILAQPLTTTDVPVALIIAGSGPTDKDGNSKLLPGKNDSLRLLAEGLAAEKIATLRFDKRGVGDSRMAVMDESALRVETFANDVVSIIAELKRKGFKRVYLVGHSEGSLIATLAARLHPVDGVVLLCGPGRAFDVIIKEQLTRQAPQLLADAERVMNQLKSGKLVAQVPPSLAPLFRPSAQPYMQSLLRLDPAKLANELPNKVLSVSGSTDIQIAAADADALAAQPNVRSTRIEHMNHVLKTVASTDQAAQLNTYSDPSLLLAPELIPRIKQFILGASNE